MPNLNAKTEWDLSPFYKDGDDPQIEKDVKQYERLCANFEKKYSDKKYLRSIPKLLDALKDLEKIAECGGRPIIYFHLRKALNSEDVEADRRIALLSERYTHAGNKTIFFGISFKEIPSEQQKRLLKEVKLERYRYLLERFFLEAKYSLSLPEEKIVSLKSRPAYSMWVSGLSKTLAKQTIQHKKKDIPLSEATELLEKLPTQERRAFYVRIQEKLVTLSDFSEAQMNAIVTNHKINDELAGFKKPYSGTVFSYENKEKVVETLVDAVTKRFDIGHEFYALKKKLLKLPDMQYVDRLAHIGSVSKTFSFTNSVNTFDRALENVGGPFQDILRTLVSKGHVDVYPKKGKRGGGFCLSDVNTPTTILLNYVDTFRSYTVLAHEMGHAFHSELAKEQPAHYQNYPTSIAEIASTFFENVAFYSVYENLSKKDKIIALADRIDDTIATIFRQIAFFNFELELHTRIREEGYLSHEDMCSLYEKHVQSYMGKAVHVDHDVGAEYVRVSHFRNFFYVYTYAYGAIISRALFAKFQKDPSYIAQIETLLSSGGSMAPADILKQIGIDAGGSDFWNIGLDTIQKDIKELKRLVR